MIVKPKKEEEERNQREDIYREELKKKEVIETSKQCREYIHVVTNSIISARGNNGSCTLPPTGRVNSPLHCWKSPFHRSQGNVTVRPREARFLILSAEELRRDRVSWRVSIYLSIFLSGDGVTHKWRHTPRSWPNGKALAFQSDHLDRQREFESARGSFFLLFFFLFSDHRDVFSNFTGKLATALNLTRRRNKIGFSDGKNKSATILLKRSSNF